MSSVSVRPPTAGNPQVVLGIPPMPSPGASSTLVPMTRPSPLRVLVAGGGVAGLETILALRALAGSRVALTLLAADPEFIVRAGTVGEAFDRSLGRKLVLAEVAAEQEAALVVGRLRAVEPEAHVAVTDLGPLGYDVLVVAAGAVATDPLPGAVTFRGSADAPGVR